MGHAEHAQPWALCVQTLRTAFLHWGVSSIQVLISNRALESVGKTRSKGNGHELKGRAGVYKVAMPPYLCLLLPQSNNV